MAATLNEIRNGIEELTEIVWSGINAYGEDFIVMKISDTNGSLPMYFTMKNQGDHDRRFFIVCASVDPAKAIAHAERHAVH